MEALCRLYGHDGVYPLDGTREGSKERQAQDIYDTNTRLIDSCDVIIANLNPFRGQEPDSGTVFEVAYAIAHGKKVYGYRHDMRPQLERMGATDADGNHVEDYGLPLNLMISIPIVLVQGDFEDALKQMVKDLDARYNSLSGLPTSFLALGGLK